MKFLKVLLTLAILFVLSSQLLTWWLGGYLLEWERLSLIAALTAFFQAIVFVAIAGRSRR